MELCQFVMNFPVYVIGRAATNDSPEQITIAVLHGRPTFMVFTKTLFAERQIDQQHLTGGIHAIEEPEHLATCIRRYRNQIEVVAIDPNPAMNRGIWIEADSFLHQTESR